MVSPGLQNWSPVPEGNSEQGLDTGAQVLTRLGPVAQRIFSRTGNYLLTVPAISFLIAFRHYMNATSG